MARLKSTISLDVFSIDKQDYLHNDIYAYIKKHVFKDKPNEELHTRDIIAFISDKNAFDKAQEELSLTTYELFEYIAKYFSEFATMRYHPLTLAKQIKKCITNNDNIRINSDKSS